MRPAQELLAVIDVQRIFAAGPWGAPRFAEIVGPVGRLVAAFGERTVFTRYVAPSDPAGAWQDYFARWPFARQVPDAPDYQLVDAFAGRPTLDATTFGKWGAIARHRGLEAGDRLVLCGVSTDCCVLSTALAAADAGVHVRVVADACAGADDASHARAIEAMALYAPLIEIVGSADLPGR